jgi:hypothetical protein
MADGAIGLGRWTARLKAFENRLQQRQNRIRTWVEQAPRNARHAAYKQKAMQAMQDRFDVGQKRSTALAGHFAGLKEIVGRGMTPEVIAAAPGTPPAEPRKTRSLG